MSGSFPSHPAAKELQDRQTGTPRGQHQQNITLLNLLEHLLGAFVFENEGR
jgi:hypothetical protein